MRLLLADISPLTSVEDKADLLYLDCLNFLYAHSLDARDYDVERMRNILWNKGARRFDGANTFIRVPLLLKLAKFKEEEN